MAVFQRSDIRKYLPNREKARDKLDKADHQAPRPASVEFVEPKVAAFRQNSSQKVTPKAASALGVTSSPLNTLEDLRIFLESGRLDGKPLTVLGYPHTDIGAVVRGYFISMSTAGLNPEFFERQLAAIMTALREEAI